MPTQAEIDAFRQDIIDHLQTYFQGATYGSRALDVANDDEGAASAAADGMANFSVDLGELAEPILKHFKG